MRKENCIDAELRPPPVPPTGAVPVDPLCFTPICRIGTLMGSGYGQRHILQSQTTIQFHFCHW